MTNKSKPCPHCKKIIKNCTCGEWECAFYHHLNKECSSEEGKRYRTEIARRKSINGKSES